MSVNERIGYWKRGAAVLQSLGHPYLYGCPLCLQRFDLDQIDQLLLSHAPPRSIGGKLRILCCTACEESSGHELDAHAYRFAEFRRILAREPHPAARARLTIEGVSANVELHSDNTIDVLANCNSPDAIKQLRAVFERHERSGAHPSEMDLSFQGARQQRARVSYLRAAYLVAFAVFGYSAIALRSFDQVRQQIREPDAAHVPEFFYRHDDLHGYEIAVVEKPTWQSSIVVLMGNSRITLPLLNDKGIYQRLAERAAVGGNWRMQCRRFEWPRWPAYGRDRQLALSIFDSG